MIHLDCIALWGIWRDVLPTSALNITNGLFLGMYVDAPTITCHLKTYSFHGSPLEYHYPQLKTHAHGEKKRSNQYF